MPPSRVFLSYSHVDESWKERLAGHLQVLGVEGLLEVWDDRRIAAGASWRQEIDAAVDQAQVAVLLISQDFLTSSFVRDVEVPRLLDRRARQGMRIVPVIVRSCPWRRVEWLAALQARPRDGRPLASFRGDRVNLELTAIAEEICDLLQGAPAAGSSAAAPAPAATAPRGRPGTRPDSPTVLARRYIRLVTGFSVGVGLGLAFYLGKISVPGFANLLEFIPFQLRDGLIPLSTLLVGVIAVFVQFYAGETIAPGRIRTLFGAGLAAVAGGLILFTVLGGLFVVRLKIGGQTVGVVTAASRLPGCGCGPESKVNDRACIERLTLAEDALASCWGGASLQRRELSLSLTYLLLIGGFAWLVGLLLVRDEGRRRQRRTAAGAARAGRGLGAPPRSKGSG